VPECSDRYFGKQVKFVVKAKVAKQVKLGTLKAVTIAGALVRLYLISEERDHQAILSLRLYRRYPSSMGQLRQLMLVLLRSCHNSKSNVRAISTVGYRVKIKSLDT
jgi:hypothetical protein